MKHERGRVIDINMQHRTPDLTALLAAYIILTAWEDPQPTVVGLFQLHKVDHMKSHVIYSTSPNTAPTDAISTKTRGNSGINGDQLRRRYENVSFVGSERKKKTVVSPSTNEFTHSKDEPGSPWLSSRASCSSGSHLRWITGDPTTAANAALLEKMSSSEREVAAVGARGPRGSRRRQTQLDASRGGQDVLTAS